MREALIFDAVRTPRGKGKKDGSLHEVKPVDLLATVLKRLQERNHLDTSQVDDVVIGCVSQLGEQGGCIARAGVLHAGWSQEAPGHTLNRFCGSGLEAVNNAAMRIRSGWEDLVVAGGVESMSRIPIGSDGGAWILDPVVSHGTSFVPQGISADLIASLEGFSRQDVDEFAAHSQAKAARARDEKKFEKSIVPVCDFNGMTLLDHDETIREGTTVETLASLKPSFAKMGGMGFDDTAKRRYPTVEHINHVHHAGNSSGIVDGAALVLIGEEEKGRELGLTPRAKIRSVAVAGAEPTIMLTGPAPASMKALDKAGLDVNDIDLFEINEAFASVVLKAQRDLELDPEKVNINGGAIAMGHPLGATGAVLLGTALDELERMDGTFALITLCIGGGMGIATVIERYSL